MWRATFEADPSPWDRESAAPGPVVAYRDVLDQAWPPDQPVPITIAVLREVVTRHWWEPSIDSQQARRVESVPAAREPTAVADVPYRREHRTFRDGAR